jgi:hypothetical protein
MAKNINQVDNLFSLSNAERSKRAYMYFSDEHEHMFFASQKLYFLKIRICIWFFIGTMAYNVKEGGVLCKFKFKTTVSYLCTSCMNEWADRRVKSQNNKQLKYVEFTYRATTDAGILPIGIAHLVNVNNIVS